jgi:hypothetical protein
MKNFRDYLAEAERKKKKAQDGENEPRPTKDKEHDWDFGDPFAAQPDQPLATRDPEQERSRDEPQAPERRTASQRDTQRAAGRIEPNQRMRDLLGRMRDIEHDPDDAGYPDPEEPETLPAHRVTTANLPAIANDALAAAGVQNPDFHKVSNLPGNMKRAIRSLGKSLFGSMTSTPTDQIHMIGNLGGQGPNSTQEVNAVANWVRNHGDDLGDGNIDFDTTIPGYSADIRQYTAAGISWLLVRDEFGNYIYSWPEQDSIQHANHAEIGQDRARLARD